MVQGGSRTSKANCSNNFGIHELSGNASCGSKEAVILVCEEKMICFFEREMGGLSGVGLRATRPVCDSGKISREDDDSTLHFPCSEGNSWANPSQ